MKLTVAEVLGFKSFADSRVESGHTQLDQPVVGISLVDDLTHDTTLGEKLLFTPVGSLDRSYFLILERVRHDLPLPAALVVLTNPERDQSGLGDQIEQIGALNVPVITVPWSKSPLEAAYFFQSKLLENVTQFVERADLIHRELTVVAVSGGELNELAETLCRLIENPVSIRNMHFEVLADAGRDMDIDPARQRSIEVGRVDADVLRALDRFNFRERLRREKLPFRVPAIPEVGMHGRIIAPIRISEVQYGYISIAECTQPLGALDMAAIERAALTGAVILAQRQERERDERRLRVNFANELIYGNGAEDSQRLLERRANVLGYRNELFTAFIVEVDSTNSIFPDVRYNHDRVDMLYDQIAILIESIRNLQRNGVRPLVMSERDGIVILYPVSQEMADNKDRLSRELNNVASCLIRHTEQVINDGKVWVGLGRPYPQQEARASYYEARKAIKLGRSLHPTGAIYYGDMGVYRLLDECVDTVPLRAFMDEQLRPLLEYDQVHVGDLVRTLRVYLKAGGNKAKTAALLPSHLNTVKYRLRQIQELTGCDPDDPEQQLSYRIALKVLDLQQ